MGTEINVKPDTAVVFGKGRCCFASAGLRRSLMFIVTSEEVV